jgi:hypothetical protein
MAKRPVFIPQTHGSSFVDIKSIDFEWHPGLALFQKKKSIISLHSSARDACKLNNILEVSTKSQDKLGVKLSAFNLAFDDPNLQKSISVECVYQASKVFEKGGPFLDILQMTSLSAKKDERLIVSGRLIGFCYSGVKWMLEPSTAFYDWIYISALFRHPDIVLKISNFDGFTDIEFNPKNRLIARLIRSRCFCHCLNVAYWVKLFYHPMHFWNV